MEVLLMSNGQSLGVIDRDELLDVAERLEVATVEFQKDNTNSAGIEIKNAAQKSGHSTLTPAVSEIK